MGSTRWAVSMCPAASQKRGSEGRGWRTNPEPHVWPFCPHCLHRGVQFLGLPERSQSGLGTQSAEKRLCLPGLQRSRHGSERKETGNQKGSEWDPEASLRTRWWRPPLFLVTGQARWGWAEWSSAVSSAPCPRMH